jgi:hypothetical protein
MMELDDLRSRRLLTITFALISGVSAVFTAIIPVVLHI